MQQKLLYTKLQIPPARPGVVRRQRLFEPISRGLATGRGMTLVSAPAGYGKSVLVAEWLRSLENQVLPGTANQTDRRIIWFSLEAGDSDPERFLSYLATAFWQNEFDYALEIKGIQDWNDFLPVEQLLTDWINSLLQPEQPSVILVFDDYHRINEPLVHRIVQFLLDHRPPQLHLILITREDPPLSLSRMRANAELTELRASDLSFTSEEASEFIQEMHLDLKPDSVLSLTERTEGWIAGLQLAALSLRQNRNAEALLEDLKGSHRYLIDYLMDEVLNAQPDDIRLFLCQTALLRRFTPGLCDALTGRDDSRSLLRTFEQTNLFLIPLDEQREWFRYHHLFTDCLRKELPMQEQKLLYRKAVRWCADQDLFEEAVTYALATADDDLAADTIEAVLNNPRAWSSGHLSMLEGWLKALPDACIHCRPSLLTVAARALSLAGKFSQAGILLERAEQMLFAQSASETAGDDLNLLLAQAGIYRAAITTVSGQLEAARSQVLQAMHRLPPGYLHVKARGLDTLAMIEEQAGCLDKAEAHFLEAAACAISAGVAYLAINALCEVAVVRLTQGRLN
ncbi:MAG: AAA family ATPase, partial [Bacillota bacterium]|nr:AAA family ATPase [Bacillota bacterium]